MNERIQQLAVQAEVKWQHQEDVIYSTMTLEQFEKFAKLIVKECARVAFESDLTMAIGQWGADSAILKHFGVEE